MASSEIEKGIQRHGLRIRLWALILVMVILTGLIMILSSLGQIKQIATDRVQNELSGKSVVLAEIYSADAERAVGRNTTPSVPSDTFARLTDAKIYYTGVRLYNKPQTLGSDLEELEGINYESTLEGITPGSAKEIRWVQDEKEMLGYASPVRLGPSQIGVVVVARPVEELDKTWKELGGTLALGMGLALTIGMLMASVISRQLSNPMIRLTRATQKVAKGDYSFKISQEDIDRQDEVGILMQNFKQMTDVLAQTEARDKRFFMSITHELRTPLTVIQGHTQMIEELDLDKEAQARSLTIIRRESEKLNRMVNDIIDLARLRGGRFSIDLEPVPIHEIVEHIVTRQKDQMEQSNITLSGEVDQTLVKADGQRIEQILDNLVLNAARYANEKIWISGKKDKNMIHISVSNDGPQIANNMREAVFEPFVGEKREGGMGLGLIISRELARAMGGDLVYEDIADGEGQGASFRLTLPLDDAKS